MNRKTAEKVLAEVEAKYSMYLDGAYGKPNLRDYTHEELSKGSWSIDWEEGPEGWVYAFRTEVPGVFVEPIAGWGCLGVFNA